VRSHLASGLRYLILAAEAHPEHAWAAQCAEESGVMSKPVQYTEPVQRCPLISTRHRHDTRQNTHAVMGTIPTPTTAQP
jgi:hypothetical protein